MGKIELDHTGSGSGITLSSDGTDLLLDGTAIGGGGAALELYAENPSSPTAPSATGANAVAIGSNTTATNTNSFAIGLGDGDATGVNAFAVGGQSTNTNAIAIGGNSRASGNGATAVGYNTDATSTGATAIGRDAQAVTGSYAAAINRAYASGADSFAAAIADNTSSFGATGANSVAMGRWTKSTNGSSVAIGYLGTSSGFGSIALGVLCEASQKYSVAFGANSSSEVIGKLAFSSGQFSSAGDSQTGTFVLRSDTTSATPENLTTDLVTAGTTNQIVLPNDSVYGFTGTVIAREDSSSTDDFAVWEIKGGAVRGASASTTALGSYNINKISESTGASNWSIALSADTTNGAVAITVTGEAAHNIRWVATVNTTEVTY